MQRRLKNVLVVSFGFLLLFTAYGGLQSLQSSLYSEAGLGVSALSTLYGSVLLSSMLLPPLLIRILGCKWTIVVSMCGYVAFSLGNFYASWYTLIPTSILLGLGAAPLWSTQCTYLTVMGNESAKKEGKPRKDVVNRYFGIFFLIFQSSGVWGNLISSLVFGQRPSRETITEEELVLCGANDCLMATRPSNSTHQPSQELVYTLLGIYTGSGILAILLIAVFLEPLQDDQQNCSGKKQLPFWSTLLSTFKLFRDRRLRLLVLLPLYSGLQQGFLSVLCHLCPGHPVRGLRDDLLRSRRLTVLPAVREVVPVHGQDGPLHAGCRHPVFLCHCPPAVGASPEPGALVFPVPQPVGRGRRCLADTEQCSVRRAL
ncbi:protein unc-93 homolog A isoform X3 [Otolemur garnettii]|uniref:protein unc-93 homolog A isoform X3 n=1 Tax=Otolemur garnettii TaxID=30611 RepID=UPI000C7F1402|nr:protein unc-93 homolog A isoform X3 [Otolemur garnettii]